MERSGGEKENVRHPELLASRMRVGEERRHASMSDPSGTWVNIPELFAVLPLLLALMLILTETCMLRCAQPQTPVTIFSLPLADTSLPFSFFLLQLVSVYLPLGF